MYFEVLGFQQTYRQISNADEDCDLIYTERLKCNASLMAKLLNYNERRYMYKDLLNTINTVDAAKWITDYIIIWFIWSIWKRPFDSITVIHT